MLDINEHVKDKSINKSIKKLPALGQGARLSASPLDDDKLHKDGALTAEIGLYFGLNPHLRVCVKCGAEVK